jgi:hypothetical protein
MENVYKIANEHDQIFQFSWPQAEMECQLAGDGIPCVTGLQELENKKVEHNINFSSCMVGQATLQPYP